MATKDLHLKPFDDETLAKLEIFQEYAKAWLPTFIMQPKVREVHIFDFFSGPGYDLDGKEGSPFRILNLIKEQTGNIFKSKTKIVVHFNEFEPKKKEQPKYEALKENVADYLTSNSKLTYFLDIKIYNKDSEVLFFELEALIRRFPSLVFLDQNGVKFLSRKYLLVLEKFEQVDFLYFVSSSYFWRFSDQEEFKQILNFEEGELKMGGYEKVHETVLDKVKSLLPRRSPLTLFPFTIKKGTNIYGIYFGAKHLRAVDKFLAVAWKQNPINGSANFDIEHDQPKGGLQMDIFSEPKLSKIESFKLTLKAMILNGTISNNKAALIFTYSKGMSPQHARECILDLKNERKVTISSSSPCINYDNVFKKKNIVTYSKI